MQWILDFDDTLVMGPNTWAFQEVLPDLIRTHDLPYDKDLFEKVMLDAQKRANEDVNEEELLDEVFTTLNWSKDLQTELMNRVFNGYQPTLFADVLPFLDQLRGRGDTLYMITNNNHAVQIIDAFNLRDYFSAILTPKSTGLRAKPHRDMWDKLNEAHEINETTMMIGDDPWSDGSFARQAGIDCWIIDRLGRYQSLHDDLPYHWATTLAEISETL